MSLVELCEFLSICIAMYYNHILVWFESYGHSDDLAFQNMTTIGKDVLNLVYKII